MRCRTFAAAMVALASLGAVGEAAELLPNVWTQVETGGGGVRRGSTVAWLADESKFLVVGGALDNKKKDIPRRTTIQTFDPASRAWAGLAGPADLKKSRSLLWANEAGTLGLHPEKCIAGSAAYDPVGRRLFVFDGNDRQAPDQFLIACYDVADREWSVISKAQPPASADGVLPGEYGPTLVFMEGTSIVYDPVNDELLFIGGRTGNAPRGFVGHWAFSLKARAWREVTATCDILDPLREACLKARDSARDKTAAERNALFGRPLPQAADLARLAREAAAKAKAALAEARTAGATAWKAEAIARARKRIEECDDPWAFDEAADLLRAMPGPRMHAAVGYDPETESIVVFGGDHGDYLLADTWLYDCRRRQWRRAFPTTAPEPRAASLFWLPGRKQLALAGGSAYEPKFIYFRRPPRLLADVWTFDTATESWSLVAAGGDDGPKPTLVCQLAAGEGDVVLGLSSAGRYPVNWDGTTWLLRVAGQAGAGTPHKARTYLSVVKEYDPRWYDAAPPADPAEVERWLAGLPPNAWTAVPKAPRPAPRRDWGTAAFDPVRDQFYHWTGGHMADPASIVSTYHPAINRWSIPYVAEYFGKGIGFNGRPDCMNHTYLNYAFDPVSKKLVCTSMGGTCIYDPDLREFEPRIDQPFRQHPYFTKTVSTPRGVVCWDRGFWGILDAAAREWKKLPVQGKLPRVVHGDENAIVYDSRRDVLWLMAADGYQKPNGQVWRYDMKTGVVAAMDPEGMKTIGVRFRPREAIYHPKLDLMFCNGFVGDRQIAYNPEQNRWVTLSAAPAHKGLGGVGIGLMYDPMRDLVWAMDGGQRMYVLKLDPATLDIATEEKK